MKHHLKKCILVATLSWFALAPAMISQADTIRVTVESRAPASGISFTPVWFATHDGSFDFFNAGEAASAALEMAAEDGEFSGLMATYHSQVSKGNHFILTGPENPVTPPLFFPGTGNAVTINLDPNNPQHRYLSLITMLLPSNDAFWGNDNPTMFPVFDAEGNFTGGEWMITGDLAYDAGTEINDEIASHVPLLGQKMPNSGITENGVIKHHLGFTPGGPILSMFPDSIFARMDYPLFWIKIERIPEDHTTIELRVESLAPQQGTLLTPFWFGLHNGAFDLFNPGHAVSPIVERVAEDGNVEPLIEAFNLTTYDSWNGILTGPVNPSLPPLFFQGQVNSLFVNIDANNPAQSYLSYISMVLPSNDAFVGNPEPKAHQIAINGEVIEQNIWIKGTNVWDAGTEVNDEAPEHVPVLGQMVPNSGVEENGIATQHPGFANEGNILKLFPAARFTDADYLVAKISVIHRFNPWEGIPLNPDGLRDSPTFGIVDDSDFPWLQHRQHGRLYLPEDGNMEGFWMYNPQGAFGWFFTSKTYYPLVYRLEDKSWYRYQLRTANPRQFENMNTGEIMTFE